MPLPANHLNCTTSTGASFPAPPVFSVSNIAANGAVNGTQSLTGAVGYTIRKGDLLTWRQYQDGVGRGGIGLFLDNTTSTEGALRDTDGQLVDADGTMNSWHVRTADLSAYAGRTISNFNLFNTTGGSPGNWSIYFGDISLVSADGKFIPIYSRTVQPPTMLLVRSPSPKRKYLGRARFLQTQTLHQRSGYSRYSSNGMRVRLLRWRTDILPSWRDLRRS